MSFVKLRCERYLTLEELKELVGVMEFQETTDALKNVSVHLDGEHVEIEFDTDEWGNVNVTSGEKPKHKMYVDTFLSAMTNRPDTIKVHDYVNGSVVTVDAKGCLKRFSDYKIESFTYYRGICGEQNLLLLVSGGNEVKK